MSARHHCNLRIILMLQFGNTKTLTYRSVVTCPSVRHVLHGTFCFVCACLTKDGLHSLITLGHTATNEKEGNTKLPHHVCCSETASSVFLLLTPAQGTEIRKSAIYRLLRRDRTLKDLSTLGGCARGENLTCTSRRDEASYIAKTTRRSKNSLREFRTSETSKNRKT